MLSYTSDSLGDKFARLTVRCDPHSHPRQWRPAITPSEESHLPDALYQSYKWCWPANEKVHRPRTRRWKPSSDNWFSACNYWFQAFPFWQFHVLFNSLFKVLFIFPSRYLFAIGLSPIFSFRWYLPPILGCNPKQPDSWKTYHIETRSGPKTGLSPSMTPCSKGLLPGLPPKTFL